MLDAGIGLALGSGTLVSSALYAELMTSVLVRRRNPRTDALIEAVAGPGAGKTHPELGRLASVFRATVTAASGDTAVSVYSHDRFRLRGYWYPVEGAVRTVICVHGWHSCWPLDFSGIGPCLHEQKCNLLLIDHRCHGGSEGDFITYGIRERYDILSWLLWLRKHHPGLPVYLLGLSMGAATVLMTAGFPIADHVAGIIADCAYTEPREIVRQALVKTIRQAAEPTLTAVNANCRLQGLFSFDDYTVPMAMEANTRIPCLFIHGEADRLVPVRMCYTNYEACRAPKDILIVEDAAHCMCYMTDPDAYRQKLSDFFASHDAVCRPKGKKKASEIA